MNSYSKIKINKLYLQNRYVISPMCQYSAENGNPSKWHYTHLLNLSKTGASLLMLESTAVSKEAKISKKDLCIGNEENKKNLRKLIKFLRKQSKIKLGIQISHAGRKGSSHIPWEKKNKPLIKGKWQTFAPSAVRRDKYWPLPKELSIKQIKKIKKDFCNAAKKVKAIGFDCLEIHMAHGYLLHQFFSKISNLRKDNYGGNLENRCRLLLDISREIKKIWPKNKILGARITGSDRLKKGNHIKEAIYLTKKLKKIGFDYVCVSSGGILPKTNLKFKKGFNVDLAKKIKKNTKIKVRTSGNIDDTNFADKLIEKKFIDQICVGRKFISDRFWILKNNKKLLVIEIANQYNRCF